MFDYRSLFGKKLVTSALHVYLSHLEEMVLDHHLAAHQGCIIFKCFDIKENLYSAPKHRGNPRAASDSCMLLLDVQMIVSEVFEYMVQGPELNSNLLCNYLFSRMLY